MLNWGDRFNICCFLDNHQYAFSHSTVECLLAAGSTGSVSANAGNAFSELKTFTEGRADWIFGHLGYDLKNETETLTSRNPDGIKMPDLFFFIPRYVVQLSKSELIIGSTAEDHGSVYAEIMNALPPATRTSTKSVTIGNRYTKQEYVDVVERLRTHILRGDCYEINLCQEFYAENIDLDPIEMYNRLSESSPNPFSAYYKMDDRYLFCMSPERYLKKEGINILSQPIKGTSKRNIDNEEDDLLNITHLKTSEKERAENIMVVDLVRNDLSRICKEGTVKVDELCAVYSFPQVHQMISTISGILKDGIHWTDAIRQTFPMGSMTGVPKKKVMELIENYERSKRGLFSGSIGYVTPAGDFDFNVVIRSLLYNSTDKYLSFHTGSAITFSSDPETEYEECLLKAEAIKKALAETNTFH